MSLTQIRLTAAITAVTIAIVERRDRWEEDVFRY